ncbi:hypothetical protein ScPMuIL_003541 [Solemya velum]
MDLKEEQIGAAVKALLAVLKKQKQKREDLLAEEQDVQLQFTMKKVPQLKNKIIKLNLPNPVVSEDADVCLFVKDLNKKVKECDTTVHHFKQHLEGAGIDIPIEVIPLRSLKTEYKPFEAKKNLSNRFDVYLADERIVRLLPSLLGKNFYGRKKHPVQVNLIADDLKTEIERAVTNSRCIIGGKGPTSMCTVGHTLMPEDDIVENIAQSTKAIGDSIPGGPDNIKNIYIKTRTSVAIPLYLSLGCPSEVVLPVSQKKRPETVVGDLTTLINAKIKVTATGKVHVVKRLRREKNSIEQRKTMRNMMKRKPGQKAQGSKTWLSKNNVKKGKTNKY